MALKKKWSSPKPGDTGKWKDQWMKDLWGTFGGRPDVIAKHVEGRGYVPIGKKPSYQPITEKLMASHWEGKIRLGTYALNKDNKCRWLAADFDDHSSKGKQFPLKDVKTYCRALEKKGFTPYVFRSKSGKGYHVYIFFEFHIEAWKIRGVVDKLVKDNHLIGTSFDRLFPTADRLIDKGRIGNLIAMPFQGEARKTGNTVLLDPATGYDSVWQDQDVIVRSIKRSTTADIEALVEEFEIEEVVSTEGGYDGDYEKDALPKKVKEECPFIAHCVEDAESLPEPEWYSMVSIIGRCIDGEKAVHEYSKAYPGYSESETDDKIRSTLDGTGPHTCAYIESINPDHCETCDNRGMINSPIQLGVALAASTLEKKGVLTMMNDKHALVRIGGKVRIIVEEPDPSTGRLDIGYQTERDFRLEYLGTEIAVQEPGKKAPTMMTKADFWIKSPKRRSYVKEVFVPANSVPDNHYNRWKGYTTKAKRGDWGLFRSHIKQVICSNDEDLYDYVMHWIADAVQNIADVKNKPGVALAIRGGQGTGKTTFGQMVCRLFDPYFKIITDSNRLTARFNDVLAESLVVFADEGFSVGGKRDTAILKGLLTGQEVLIERKGLEVQVSPNYSRIIFASNDQHIIQMSGDDRRFCVLDISPARARDRAYFQAMVDQMDNKGGLAAFRYDMLKFNIKRDLTEIPQTRAQIEQKEQSGSSIEQWWREKLDEGTNTVSFDSELGGNDSDPWKEQLLFKTVHEDYKEWCRDNCDNKTDVHTHGPTFSSRWKAMLPPRTVIKRKKKAGIIKFVVHFCTLQDTRAAFEIHMGVVPGTLWNDEQ